MKPVIKIEFGPAYQPQSDGVSRQTKKQLDRHSMGVIEKTQENLLTITLFPFFVDISDVPDRADAAPAEWRAGFQCDT
jgi:hypothetical protein